MKKVTKDFAEKIARAGGVYDTKKYRYIIDGNGTIKRTLIENLDTTAMLEKDAWEVVGEY